MNRTELEEKLAALMENPGIIRNRRKLRAAVDNARVFLEIQEEFGSFYAYLRRFTGDTVDYEWDKTTSPESDALSKDLRKRGMGFVGSTTVYAYLQAIGLIHSHEPGCFLHRAQM